MHLQVRRVAEEERRAGRARAGDAARLSRAGTGASRESKERKAGQGRHCSCAHSCGLDQRVEYSVAEHAICPKDWTSAWGMESSKANGLRYADILP
jgi:hypothetical protein